MKSLIVYLQFFFFLTAISAGEKTFLSVSKAFPQRLKVFLSSTGKSKEETPKLLSIMARDLLYSGYFTASVSDSYPVKDVKKERQKAKTYDLFCLLEQRESSFTVKVEETGGWENLFQNSYTWSTETNRLAHRIVDDIVQALTGKPGIAQSQICFVGCRQSGEQIYVVDYDGENLYEVTGADKLKKFPRWFPDKDRIVCLVEDHPGFRFGIFSLSTRQLQLLSSSLAAGPAAVNPRYSELAAVFCDDGNAEIYRVDRETGAQIRLTFSRFLETSPCFSPDGEEIVFVSDRTGQSHLYVMDRHGRSIRPLYYPQAMSYSPDWSPDGRLICFVLEKSAQRKLALYDLMKKEVRVIPSTGNVDCPRWAPDSRHLVFTKTGAEKRQLVILDSVREETRLLVPEELKPHSPAWSR